MSLGYVVQVYPYDLLHKYLERPEITFKAWNKKDGGGEFDFDTQTTIKSHCNKHLLFFLDKIYLEGSHVGSIYNNELSFASQRWWSFCFSFASHQDDTQHICILSKAMTGHWFKACYTTREGTCTCTWCSCWVEGSRVCSRVALAEQ